MAPLNRYTCYGAIEVVAIIIIIMAKSRDLPPRKHAKIEILLKEVVCGSKIVKKFGVSPLSVTLSAEFGRMLQLVKVYRPDVLVNVVVKGQAATSTQDESLLTRKCRKNRKASSRQLQGMMEHTMELPWLPELFDGDYGILGFELADLWRNRNWPNKWVAVS